MRRLTATDKARAAYLRRSGWSLGQIAIVLGRYPSTWSRHLGARLPPGAPRYVAAAAAKLGILPETYLDHAARGERWDARHRRWATRADLARGSYDDGIEVQLCLGAKGSCRRLRGREAIAGIERGPGGREDEQR